MKRFLSVLFSIVIVLVSTPIIVAAPDYLVKIDPSLQVKLEVLDDDDYINVIAYLTCIDDEIVLNDFSKRYPAEYDCYMNAKYSEQFNSDELIIDGNGKDDMEKSMPIDPIKPSDEDLLLQRAIEIKRSIYKEYYTSSNNDIVCRYCQDSNCIFISNYSPIAILNLTKATLVSMLQDDGVLYVNHFIDSDGISESIESINESLELANMITRADYVRDHYGLTGNGVKIGLIDVDGVPRQDPDYLSSANIIRRQQDHIMNDHPTRIARILVGSDSTGNNDGIVPDATLYCCTAGSKSQFYIATEWLVGECKVNIINFSGGYSVLNDVFANGTYDELSRWVDHIAFEHDVHFVKSAGNYNIYDPTYYITSPGMAYNAITVGGLKPNNSTVVQNYAFPTFSKYQESSSPFNRPEKPNLVAPSSSFWNNQYNDGIGTSFSAPQVTGVIAQLCCYKSALKTQQSTVGAIMAASSAKKIEAVGIGEKGDKFAQSVRVNSNEQISDHEGAGILDAYWARLVAKRNQCWAQTITPSAFPYTKTITIDHTSNTVIRVAIFWLQRSICTDDNHSYGGNSSAPIMPNLILSVYDANDTLIGSSNVNKGNFEIVQFEPSYTGQYKIVISYSGACTNNVRVGIAVW